jgi:hypothetical protein
MKAKITCGINQIDPRNSQAKGAAAIRQRRIHPQPYAKRERKPVGAELGNQT